MRIPLSCLNPSRSSTSIPVSTCASIGSEFTEARALLALKRARLANNSAAVADASCRAFSGAASEKARQERSEEHTSELQSRENLVCRLLLEKKKQDSQ